MSWFTHLLGIINWKTTFAGGLALITTLAAYVPALAPVSAVLNTVVVPVLLSIGLISAKDSNVTGGTVPATREADTRIAPPMATLPPEPPK